MYQAEQRAAAVAAAKAAAAKAAGAASGSSSSSSSAVAPRPDYAALLAAWEVAHAPIVEREEKTSAALQTAAKEVTELPFDTDPAAADVISNKRKLCYGEFATAKAARIAHEELQPKDPNGNESNDE